MRRRMMIRRKETAKKKKRKMVNQGTSGAQFQTLVIICVEL
jgi:hypothetical protein